MDMAKKANKPAAAQPTGLEEAVNRWEQFFENHKNTIFGAMIAIVVIIAGSMIYSAKVAAPRQTRASEALFPGETYFTQGDYETALNGDGVSYEGFEAVAKQYGNTKAGKLAKAYAGLCYAQLGNNELAIENLSKFKGKDKMVAPAVLGALANCYATAGDNAKAASTFEAAAKKADNGLLSPYYYLQAAIIYEAMDNQAQALKLYKTIKVKYPESQEGLEADKYIARLSSK